MKTGKDGFRIMVRVTIAGFAVLFLFILIMILNAPGPKAQPVPKIATADMLLEAASHSYSKDDANRAVGRFYEVPVVGTITALDIDDGWGWIQFGTVQCNIRSKAAPDKKVKSMGLKVGDEVTVRGMPWSGGKAYGEDVWVRISPCTVLGKGKVQP